MNDKMSSLQHLFDQASNRPLAFSEAQLRDLLARHDAAPGQSSAPALVGSTAARALRLLAAGLVIATVGTLTFGPSSDGDEGALGTTSAAVEHPLATTSPRVQAKSHQTPSGPTERSTAAVSPSAPTRSDGNLPPAPASTTRGGGLTLATPTTIVAAAAVTPLPVSPTIAIDIAESEQGALGIRRLPNGRTAYGYYLVANLPQNLAPNVSISESMLRNSGYQDSLLVQTIGRRGRSDVFMSRADFPLGVVTRKASAVGHAWQVITDESGRLLDERVSISDADQLRYVSDLFKRGASDAEITRTLSSVRGLGAISQSLRLNTLLPIRVTLGDDAGRGVFWCRPDPQLIAQLPARTVAQLRRELERSASVVGTTDTLAIVRRGWALSVLATIDSIRPESLQLDSDIDLAPQGMTGAEIFAGSRRNAGVVARFEPTRNPVSGTATFSLELAQPRRVTVTLHDVNGRRLRTLTATTSFDEGASEISAPLAGIDKGLYLVSISTDKREQVVHRIVVE